MTHAEETEHEVLAANERFYRAFSEGDLESMSALWAQHAPVACLHPGQPVLLGRDAVLRPGEASWSTSPASSSRARSRAYNSLATPRLSTATRRPAMAPRTLQPLMCSSGGRGLAHGPSSRGPSRRAPRAPPRHGPQLSLGERMVGAP
jgi:hypothetical protein